MHRRHLVSLLSACALASALLAHRHSFAGARETVEPPIVVLELFTSEGCSSCPAADRLLTQLASESEDVHIVPLALHVDYWDHLGWKDRFSSREFSDRQRGYAAASGSRRVYTPQLIVDGTTELVGSDRRGARRAIARAATGEKVSPSIEILSSSGREISLRIHAAAQENGFDDAELLLAITENGLSTRVERGENAGRTLEHAGVVRRLFHVADVDGRSAAAETVTLSLDANWNVDRLHVVAFLQERRSRRIVGAATRPLGEGR